MSNPSATLTRKSTARDPRTVELSLRSDGTLGALSSDGVTIYSVRRHEQFGDVVSCTCLGWRARGICCHAAAVERAGTCAWCDTVSAAVVTYLNGFDGGAELALCPACFTPAGVQ